ncbi:MAG: glycosyltransferase family 2 protein [Acidobacteriota bacterium]
MKISVIIPTFERNFKLKRAVKSVLNQTFQDFQIIVVNDSSNENETKKMLNSFNDKRIKYFRNRRNKGGNGARNTGIINSRSDYIAFLDDDDEWYENKLQDQYNYLRNSDKRTGGVWSGFYRVEDGEWKVYKTKIIDNMELFLKEVIFENVIMCAGSNLMVKREVVRETGLFDETLKRHQDLEYIVRILRNFKLFYMNKIHSRIYPSRKDDPEILEKAFIPYIKKIEPELIKFSSEDKKNFFAHKYYNFAKLFSEEKNFFKTLKYCLKTLKVRLINPITIISFLIKSLKNN